MHNELTDWNFVESLRKLCDRNVDSVGKMTFAELAATSYVEDCWVSVRAHAVDSSLSEGDEILSVPQVGYLFRGKNAGNSFEADLCELTGEIPSLVLCGIRDEEDVAIIWEKGAGILQKRFPVRNVD